jgi:hypothetical protein
VQLLWVHSSIESPAQEEAWGRPNGARLQGSGPQLAAAAGGRLWQLRDARQIKAAATGAKSSKTVFYSATSCPWYESERKMEQRPRPATTVVASPRQWRILVANPSDSLRGLRCAFPEEVLAMERFALTISLPYHPVLFWHFACSCGSCTRCAHAFRDAHIACRTRRARPSFICTEMICAPG